MIKRLLLLATVTVLAVTPLVARKINIHGQVTLQGSGEPASGASIIDASTNKLLGITGEDGRYNISADSEGELIFSFMVSEDVHQSINGRHIIDVALMPQATELGEVVVTGRGGKAVLMTEQTDLDLEGNKLRLKTKVKVPSKLFNSEVRMIIQPALYNVTRKHLSYLSPVVFDGWRYAVTQERMYDWDKQRDSLTAYQQVKRTSGKTDDTIYLLDSLHVENPNDDFMGLILTTLEDYNRIIYTDTFEIARGTVNPLRFLSYKLDPMAMNEERFLPTAEVELKDAAGEIDLMFPVGKSKLDLTLGNNAKELDALVEELRVIERNPDMSLKSFSISGSASPEGRYELNLSLAQERMKSAMETILGSIDPSLRRNAELSSDASVATWEDVVEMMRADGLNDEADKMQNVIDRYPTKDGRSWQITRLPFYKSVIAEKYLPRLRRVNYHIVSSAYRPLTDEEIAELYKSNPAGLSKYQFYRYYSKQQGDAREKAIREALAAHPDFTVAATDLSEIMLARGENPTAILEPFFNNPKSWSKLPMATRLNMGVACMNDQRFSLADSILSTLPDIQETHKAKIYSAAQNGRFHDVIEEINEDSPLNEVILLLAVKSNNHAWEKARELGNSAVEEYIKAVAANRLDLYMEAMVHLENAFKLDPSLRDIAKIDGDVIDLLDADETSETTDSNDSNE